MGYLNRNIKSARKLAGFTQESIAQKLGKARSTYASWEDNIQPSMEDLNEIAKACKININDLLQENSNLVGKVKNVVKEDQALYKKAEAEGLKGDSVAIIKYLEDRLLRTEETLQTVLSNLDTVMNNQVAMAAMNEAAHRELLADVAERKGKEPKGFLRTVRSRGLSLLGIYQKEGIQVGAGT